jgi:hypothetical protein
MQLFPALAERSGVLIGLPAVALGFAMGGTKTAILAGLVGFFVGMSRRSGVRTFAIDSASQ